MVKAVKQGQDEITRTDPDSALIEMTNLTAEEYKKKYDEGYGKKEGEQYVDQRQGEPRAQSWRNHTLARRPMTRRFSRRW